MVLGERGQGGKGGREGSSGHPSLDGWMDGRINHMEWREIKKRKVGNLKKRVVARGGKGGRGGHTTVGFSKMGRP